MDQRRLENLRRMRSSLAEFGEKCLRIKTKERDIIPFVMNTAQLYLHKIIEDQLEETGKVRVLVLKGRQQGISTYVAARYYHKSSMFSATNVYILSHEQKATDNLFEMVDRYHTNNPLAPITGKSNAKALTFPRLDSSYTVATAGQKAGGRGRTPHLFHGSEVAFWANASEHFAASLQGVPDLPGTEVIMETTANGVTGEFYERWQEAEAGEGDFIAVFIPWYWQDEYRREPSEDFKLKADGDEENISEEEYAEMFKLTDAQMMWRRAKISQLGSQSTFDQEYPATAQLAFISASTNTFIKGASVLRARKRTVTGAGPLIMGADPAGPGGDRFSIAERRGLEVGKVQWRNKIGTAEAYHWCKTEIMTKDPARFNVDAGGIGAAVLDLLRNDDDIPKGVVRGINFGTKSQAKQANPDKAGPKNRRAEMWQRSKTWLELEEGVSIPDLDVLQADATGVQLKDNLTNDIQLESKEAMRARGIRSPDLWDAIALTFASTAHIKDYSDAEVVTKYGDVVNQKPRPRAVHRSAGPQGWMS